MTAKNLDKNFAEFKKDPTEEHFNKLVEGLKQLVIPSPNEISITDECGRRFVIDRDKERWHELFEEAKVDKKHEKAFGMIVDYFGIIGFTSNEVVRKNKDIVVFILDCEKHKEDGQAGLFLHHQTKRWELGSLDPNKPLTGIWEINQADTHPSHAFDEMMETNYDWDLAYSNSEE